MDGAEHKDEMDEVSDEAKGKARECIQNIDKEVEDLQSEKKQLEREIEAKDKEIQGIDTELAVVPAVAAKRAQKMISVT